MQINRRITNGLAWAGALLVIGVPTADLLSAQFFGPRDAQIAVTAPVPVPAAQRPAAPVEETVAETAAATPAPTRPAATNDAVGSFEQGGRRLPSYITGGSDAPPTAVATAPRPTTPTAPTATPAPAPAPAVAATEPTTTRPLIQTDPVEVASLPRDAAPVPMPLSMRPRPMIAATQPNYQQPGRQQQVVIPPAVASQQPVQVSADDLADWEAGPLSEFLANRQQQRQPDPYYAEGGAYLDELAPAERQRDRYIGPVDEPLFFPFGY